YSTDLFTITCVANAHPYKGHADLYAALKLCGDKLPNWRLVLIGNGKLNWPTALDRFVTHVTTSKPTYWLCQTDLFVLPSHSEGFSNALLEAMSLGLPCIACCVGGNLDAIQHNISGLLVAPKHPFDLAHAILTLANDPQLRGRLGHNAQQLVRRHFSLKQ